MSTHDQSEREHVSFDRLVQVAQFILTVVMILHYLVTIGQSCT